jgi:DNA repair exonuclease SbcCD ATPase subunit
MKRSWLAFLGVAMMGLGGCMALDYALTPRQTAEQREAAAKAEKAAEDLEAVKAKAEEAKKAADSAATPEEKAEAEAKYAEAAKQVAELKAQLEAMMKLAAQRGTSMLEDAAPIASPWFPWATALAGLLTTVYTAVRGKDKDRWEKSAKATWTALEEFLKSPAGQPIEKQLKAYMATHHEVAGVYDFVKATVEKFDH